MRSFIAPVLVLALSGCAVESSDSPPIVQQTPGVLVVDWSISGAQDSSICRQSSADVINIELQTSDGVDMGQFEDDCEAFETSIDLAPGDYVGDAILLDSAGSQRTTAVDLGPIQIFGNDQLVVPVDFPPDSFY